MRSGATLHMTVANEALVLLWDGGGFASAESAGRQEKGPALNVGADARCEGFCRGAERT